jgi:hypothetical protein
VGNCEKQREKETETEREREKRNLHTFINRERKNIRMGERKQREKEIQEWEKGNRERKKYKKGERKMINKDEKKNRKTRLPLGGARPDAPVHPLPRFRRV